jgi:glycosyltransferase involved in cell wall biosynthesis
VKGSDRLAAALPLAWSAEPDLALVLCGNVPLALAQRWQALWGAQAEKVRWLPPQPRPALLGVLERAAALVAVSRCENLPNLALEALALDTPLVAHRGASFEELVEDGRNGTLVDADSAPALAQALVEAWRGQGPFAGGRLPRGPIWQELEPQRAVERLVEFLGREP